MSRWQTSRRAQSAPVAPGRSSLAFRGSRATDSDHAVDAGKQAGNFLVCFPLLSRSVGSAS